MTTMTDTNTDIVLGRAKTKCDSLGARLDDLIKNLQTPRMTRANANMESYARNELGTLVRVEMSYRLWRKAAESIERLKEQYHEVREELRYMSINNSTSPYENAVTHTKYIVYRDFINDIDNLMKVE